MKGEKATAGTKPASEGGEGRIVHTELHKEATEAYSYVGVARARSA